MTEKKCAEIVNQEYLKRLEDYQSVSAYFNLSKSQRRKHEKHEDLNFYESLFDYANQSGLGFDFVSVDTFENQERGYWRFQMSWGGPSDEFRIYVDATNKIDYIDYHYLDWFDGASVRVRDDIIYDICEMFLDGCDNKDFSDIYKYEQLEAL
jgi:hypothetical protein